MNHYDQARQLVQVMLKIEKNVTTSIIQDKVDTILNMLKSQSNKPLDVDRERLVRELESMFNTSIGIGKILDNKEDHIPWLADRRSEINWDFWDRYKRYLEEEKSWAPAIIERLDSTTDDVLARLEDPCRENNWDRRGMVVGQVQSGKTANYTGLICKAVDAGYKLIIVLAGMQNSLRSQTQLRLDEGFLGFDSQTDRGFTHGSSVGVGKIIVSKRLNPMSATSSAEKGDFNQRVAHQFAVLPGGNDPLLMVVKKNKSVLNNLYRWALRQGVKDRVSEKRVIREIPLLIIDDEADHASLNTNPPLFDDNGKVQEELDVSAINGLIRKLLNSFDQSSYIGYTATPFANIFIYPDPEIKNPDFGEDLFPRSFIINLPTPSNHIGPVQVFGLDVEQNSSLESVEGLPIVHPIYDHENWMPTKHRKGHIPTEPIPPSLTEAIRSFILGCAIRMARGQENEHNSMLIHVTRYTDVQGEVYRQVRDTVTDIKRRLRYGDGNSSQQIISEFKELWKHNFIPTSQEILKIRPNDRFENIQWDEIKVLLYKSADKIQIKKINGTAKDVLEYWEYKNGLSVIAIGGDKLSRGLTLEGLTVSYYLRASKMYDTLMQMGRWFGYRPGYLDLCRLYTTDDLIQWYEHITVASEELRQEFDYMVDSGATPRDFGLKVRTHPQGLMITGANKMKTGTRMELSFAGSISETTIFYKDDAINKQNFEATENFLLTLGSYHEQGKDCGYNYLWRNVHPDRIIDFLLNYQSHPKCRVAKTSLLADYIKAQLPMNELVSWTVIVISSQRAAKQSDKLIQLAKLNIGFTERKQADSSTKEEYRLKKSRLLSPTDEWLDLTQSIRDEIMYETRRLREEAGKPPSSSLTPNGKVIRAKRQPKNGLLLLYPLDPKEINSDIPPIGFAVSFPGSNTARRIEYLVNNDYWEQEFYQV
jgi:Z1 domain